MKEANIVQQISTGYLHPDYALSLAEFGKPRELTGCGGWILERQIPDYPDSDAMGCYPLFVCRDWSRLHEDLDSLEKELVSLSLVTDPFGSFDLSYLKNIFDLVIPFKEHYVVDCSQPITKIVSKNHIYQARKALKKIQGEICEEPWSLLDEWTRLHDVLVRRHRLEGFHVPSRKAFSIQLRIPGLILFRATYEGETVGVMISFIQGEVGYAHLIASSEVGYKLGASYALFWCTIEYLMNKVKLISIGASAGTIEKESGKGLDFFKRGWASQKRTTYFCGRILNPEKYSKLVAEKGLIDIDYFPAYRKGEFR